MFHDYTLRFSGLYHLEIDSIAVLVPKAESSLQFNMCSGIKQLLKIGDLYLA